MVNQDKGKAEQFVLRGNADSVMRQLVDEYNSSNGWSVNRIVNNILNFTVVLERNSEQGVSKDNSSDTTKDTTKAETKTNAKVQAEYVQTDGDTVRVSTEEPTDVEPKPVKATTRKAKTQA